MFELQFELELLELFELVFELLFELELELELELEFELVLELELLELFDELLLSQASLTSASATAGTSAGAARAGWTGVACAAPAPSTPAAMMVTLYFMADCSFSLGAVATIGPRASPAVVRRSWGLVRGRIVGNRGTGDAPPAHPWA